MALDTIYNEDCLKGLERLYGTDIPLIVTDPPYEVITQGGGTINNTKRLSTSLKALDDLSITRGARKPTISIVGVCHMIACPRFSSRGRVSFKEVTAEGEVSGNFEIL